MLRIFFGRTATLGYAVLVGAGGLLAGIRTGSKPSIISGVVSCIILSLAYVVGTAATQATHPITARHPRFILLLGLQ